MTNKIEISRELAERILAIFPDGADNDGSGSIGFLPHVGKAINELRALLAAPAVELPAPVEFPGYPPVPEGRKLPTPAVSLASPKTRYVRVPSREDPKYNAEWPEIEGGLVFEGRLYCAHLFEALKRERITLVETLPVGAVDE